MSADLEYNGKLIYVFRQCGVFKYRIGHRNKDDPLWDKAFRTAEEAQASARMEIDAMSVWNDAVSEWYEKRRAKVDG
jgi:hypothetical protein